MKPASAFLVLVLLAVIPGALRASALTRDLGDGLVYHRVATLPSDLPNTAAERKQPCVLDLRYAHGDAAAGTALSAWLKFNASVRTPVFLLVNADTETALLASLALRLPATGIIVIGTTSPGLTPDIVLKPEDERRAFDALAAGAPVESLLNDTPEKLRNDEARLAKDHQNQPSAESAATPDDALDDLPVVEKSPKATPPAPLIDAALQRAVQLHRSLRALKKL